MREAAKVYGGETFCIHGLRLAVVADEEWVRGGVCEALRAFHAPIDRADATMVIMGGSRRGESALEASPIRAALAAEPPYDVPSEFRFGGMRCYRAGFKIMVKKG